ncbi:putative Crossover junction endodeoxyribonuclease RuvC [Candidatus Zixiibacteriota bacterium]|nr:putative Crossover junction endodeoxyribonuclease RuvC [candidate division Zixibacteria bacterium]
MKKKTSLLAIDPGFREMGFAHFEGIELVDYGVKVLRRSKSSRRPLMILARVMDRLIYEKSPSVLALEKNCFSIRHPGIQVVDAIQVIKRKAFQNNIHIYEYAASTIKKSITGDGRATKRLISKVISANIPELKAYKISNCHWKEIYYQNMFDAVACGLTHLNFSRNNQVENHEIKN